jgi:phytol kinase
MAVVLGALIVLMVALRAHANARRPHPEVSRKLLHVGMGVVTLSFPWLFASTWPVWVLSAVSVLLLAATRTPSALQRRLGGVIDTVERSSLGDIYFPIGVASIFQLSHRDPVLYGIPVLLLTVADATAALIGTFYGKTRYDAVEGTKSAEGSLAFFLVAFLSTHVVLLLCTDTGRVESLLLGLTVGLLVMMIEAVAWKGLDNLLVPLGGFLLLTGYMHLSVATLATLFGATVVWVAFVFALRGRSTLNDAAMIGAALVGYLSWTIGGWAWAIPPVVLFLGYMFAWPLQDVVHERRHDVHAVAAICAPGLLWLALSRTYVASMFSASLYCAYTAFYAAQLAFIAIAYYRELRRTAIGMRAAIACAAMSGALLFVPCLLVSGFSARALSNAAIGLATVFAASIVFNAALPKLVDDSQDRFLWFRQALVGGASSALCLVTPYLLRG